MESRTVQFWLGRLLAGACLPADVLPLAREAGFPSFAELCSASLPERLPRLRIETAAIVQHVERALGGQLPLAALSAWADELHAIAFHHVIGKSRTERRRAVEALALIATAADEGLFPTRPPCHEVLREVAGTLEEGRALAVAELYGRLFVGQRLLHLAARRPVLAGTDDVDASWADVVLRPAPGKASPDDRSAVVAFAVVTERAASGDDPGHGAPLPGALARIRQLVPNFAFGQLRPRLRRDVDGILELVLRAEEIGRPEIVYAAKLFALLHGVEALTLDGERVAVLRI